MKQRIEAFIKSNERQQASVPFSVSALFLHTQTKYLQILICLPRTPSVQNKITGVKIPKSGIKIQQRTQQEKKSYTNKHEESTISLVSLFGGSNKKNKVLNSEDN